MAQTQAGALKTAAKLKAKYGVDAHGRSLFHAKIGSIGGENSPGYFKELKKIDPKRLKEVASLGGHARAKKIKDAANQD